MGAPLKFEETPIAKKIEEQSEFVRWWKETVSVRHGLNRHSVEISELQSLEKEKAESLTGITAVQVSRWRKKLVDASKYEAELFEAAYNLRPRFIYYIQRIRRNFRQKPPEPATRISGTQSPLRPIHKQLLIFAMRWLLRQGTHNMSIPGGDQ